MTARARRLRGLGGFPRGRLIAADLSQALWGSGAGSTRGDPGWVRLPRRKHVASKGAGATGERKSPSLQVTQVTSAPVTAHAPLPAWWARGAGEWVDRLATLIAVMGNLLLKRCDPVRWAGSVDIREGRVPGAWPRKLNPASMWRVLGRKWSRRCYLSVPTFLSLILFFW